MGEAKTSYFLKVSNQVVITFCAAGVALCDIPTCFITCPKSIFWCDRRNTLASLSEDELHFSQQAQHFGDLHRHFAWQAQRRVAAARCVCFFWRIALSGLRQVVTMCVGHRESVILRGRGSISDTLHSLHSIHFTLHTLQLTLYTPHPTYTLHFTHPTFTLHTLHFTLHTSGFEFGERGRARLLTHIRL